MARRRKGLFFRKHLLTIALGAVVLLLIAGMILLLVSCSNPYRTLLRQGGVEVEKCRLKQNVLTLTFEGDAVGILSCRDALNLIRTREKTPDRVDWILVREGETVLTGSLSSVGDLPENESPRVETLDGEMTLLKLKYELARSGLTASAKGENTVGISGKTVTVTIPVSDRQSLSAAETVVPAAVKAVNEEGGGIVRCNVLFTENEGVFAAASYDFVYGDVLYSSAFERE